MQATITRLGLPKGRLFEGVRARLAAGGLTFLFESERDYHPRPSDPRIAATMYKPRSLPRLCELGFCDAIFAGLDVVREARAELTELVDLALAPVRIVVAVPADRPRLLLEPPRRPLVIATEYPQLAGDWAMSRGLAHLVIESHGSTEAYVQDVADVVVDCVETGATLAANGLVEVETLFSSSTRLFARRAAAEDPAVQAIASAARGGTG
ncbi:MAG: ATP phosphoribosyltransferase [Polyangiaceae bacterium]